MCITIVSRLSGGVCAIHEIGLDGADREICRDCADDIWSGGNPEKLKKVGQSTVYRSD